MKVARVAALCWVALGTPGVASALEMHWASGEGDLRFEAGTRCTLFVCASGTTSLPTEWRLSYAVDGMDERIQFRSDYSEPGTAGICWAPGEELTPADRAARKQTVQHCNLYTTLERRASGTCSAFLRELEPPSVS